MEAPRKYMKKPVVIEALRYNGRNYDEVFIFTNGTSSYESIENRLTIPTLEGKMVVSVGDYIIKGVCGEFYPCKPNIFNATYEEV